jgi:type I restriction enzyme R subunit
LPSWRKSGDGTTAIIHDGDQNPRLRRVLEIDSAVKNSRPAGWRGNTAKEEIIKEALYRTLDFDENEVERIFPIILAQTEY